MLIAFVLCSCLWNAQWSESEIKYYLSIYLSYKFLGHYITDDLSDDDDINRQRRTLFVQGNIILRKFNMCSLGVKLTLFRTYCSPMYTAQLWWNYKKSTITKLQIAYHNIF